MRRLSQYADMIEAALGEALPDTGDELRQGDIAPQLNHAMRYSLLEGGKRLRPAMLLAAVDMLDGDLDEAMPYACAIEMIHCYSLVHDDLPGMDDDVLRRGKPTTHVAFGVGQAILAGDALLNLANELMLDAALRRPDGVIRHLMAASEIAQAAGARGMISGQSVDLLLEQALGGGLRELQYIHKNKTAALFVGAIRAAGQLVGAPERQMEALTRFGQAFGLLFQTVDDLLDVLGDQQTLGKSVGKDEQSGKLTAVKLYGLGGARELCGQFLRDGLEALEPFGERAAFFRELMESMASRTS